MDSLGCVGTEITKHDINVMELQDERKMDLNSVSQVTAYSDSHGSSSIIKYMWSVCLYLLQLSYKEISFLMRWVTI